MSVLVFCKMQKTRTDRMKRTVVIKAAILLLDHRQHEYQAIFVQVRRVI